MRKLLSVFVCCLMLQTGCAASLVSQSNQANEPVSCTGAVVTTALDTGATAGLTYPLIKSDDKGGAYGTVATFAALFALSAIFGGYHISQNC